MAGDHHGGSELGRFLRARRAQVAPAEVGILTGPRVRRTTGLRREELATLTGVSVAYYARIERGTETHPSAAVLDALAGALRLGEAEHEHLRELAARAGHTVPTPRAAPRRTVRPGAQLLLESLRPNPAHVVGRTGDLLTYNPSGLRLLAGMADWPPAQRNIARYLFLHPGSRDLFDDWANQVRGCVGHLRALADSDPDASDLTRLVGELLLKSHEFARLWERYDVSGHSYGSKTFHHPDVGDLTLGYQAMAINGGDGQSIVVYYAEPGTAEYDAMVLLDMAAAESEQHWVTGAPNTKMPKRQALPPRTGR
jgi:transcriptional regulator with XRE-family HTH domain